MANIIFKNAVITVNGDDFVIDDEGILKHWLEDNDTEGATIAIVLFGNNYEIANRLDRYFDAKHGVPYVRYKEEKMPGYIERVIGRGQAMLRTLALKYGVSVETLEKVAEAQWIINTY